MTQNDYVNYVCNKLARMEAESPLLIRAARAVFLSAEPTDAWETHAVLERLAVPDRRVSFRLEWMDDRGRVRLTDCFFAAYGGLPCRSVILLRPGLTGDEAACRVFYGMLTGSLIGGGPGFVCGADIDAGALSDGESMRFCRRLSHALERLAGADRTDARVWEGPSPREHGYLSARCGRGDGMGLSCPEAAGSGLCFCADEALRRRYGAGLCGRSAAVLGHGAVAAAAGKTAARMGARLVPGGADVWLLCDDEDPMDLRGAEALLAQGPDGVFEGVYMACAPEAAERIAGTGTLFVPAAAAAAGAAVRVPRDISTWDAQAHLRRTMRRILEAAARPGEEYRGVYAAAAARASDILIRRGV